MGDNSMNECTVDDCDKPTRSSKAIFCVKHYARWRRNGDPTVSAWDIKRDRNTTEGHDRGGKTKTHSRCKICNKVKPRAEFYERTDVGWLSSYCRPCQTDYYRAKNAEAKANRPPKPPKPVVPCAYEECDRDSESMFLGDNSGPWCKAHWQMKRDGRELGPIRVKRVSFIDENLRRCTTCDRIKPNERFHLKADKVTRQSECKDCTCIAARFYKLRRDGDLEKALSVLETMPERMYNRMVDRYATFFSEENLNVPIRRVQDDG